DVVAEVGLLSIDGDVRILLLEALHQRRGGRVVDIGEHEVHLLVGDLGRDLLRFGLTVVLTATGGRTTSQQQRASGNNPNSSDTVPWIHDDTSLSSASTGDASRLALEAEPLLSMGV